MTIWNEVHKWWDVPLALGVAVAASWFLAADSLRDVTGELITFFGIQSAVILPSMLFTAGLLGPEGLTIEQAQRFHKALGQQMTFWTVLLTLDFLAVIVLITGKALGWQIVIHDSWTGNTLDVSRILIFLVAFLAILALLRTIPFVRGIKSLHELRGELIQLAIRSRNSQTVAKSQAADRDHAFITPEGYGGVHKRSD